jgi:hypothetical protein
MSTSDKRPLSDAHPKPIAPMRRAAFSNANPPAIDSFGPLIYKVMASVRQDALECLWCPDISHHAAKSDNPENRYKRYRKQHPEHPESELLVAFAYKNAKDHRKEICGLSDHTSGVHLTYVCPTHLETMTCSCCRGDLISTDEDLSANNHTVIHFAGDKEDDPSTENNNNDEEDESEDADCEDDEGDDEDPDRDYRDPFRPDGFYHLGCVFYCPGCKKFRDAGKKRQPATCATLSIQCESCSRKKK